MCYCDWGAPFSRVPQDAHATSGLLPWTARVVVANSDVCVRVCMICSTSTRCASEFTASTQLEAKVLALLSSTMGQHPSSCPISSESHAAEALREAAVTWKMSHEHCPNPEETLAAVFRKYVSKERNHIEPHDRTAFMRHLAEKRLIHKTADVRTTTLCFETLENRQ